MKNIEKLDLGYIVADHAKMRYARNLDDLYSTIAHDVFFNYPNIIRSLTLNIDAVCSNFEGARNNEELMAMQESVQKSLDSIAHLENIISAYENGLRQFALDPNKEKEDYLKKLNLLLRRKEQKESSEASETEQQIMVG